MKKEILTIDKERVRKCMEDCPEFKDIAIKLWPGIELEMEKTPEVDITKDIDWGVMNFSDAYYWLMGSIDGIGTFYIKDVEAIIFNHPDYREDYDVIKQGSGFKIVRKAK